MKISFSNINSTLKQCANSIENMHNVFNRGNWTDDVHESYNMYIRKADECKTIFIAQTQKVDEIETVLNSITDSNEIVQNVKRLKLEADSVQE